MLVKPHELFERARTGEYALGAFAASNLEMTQAIVWAAQVQRSPVVVQTSEQTIRSVGLKILVNIVRTLADDTECPIVLELDHGADFALIQACIEAGYTSVMIDATADSFAENVRRTREVVEYAHGRGVWVEAGIGTDSSFTKPTEAKQFVEATELDALAVSCGTIHGAFTGQEYIQFELIEAIEKYLPALPLVLHGASGVVDRHVAAAAQTNVCKVNFATELKVAFVAGLRSYLGDAQPNPALREMLAGAQEAVQAVVEQKICLLGSVGQGEHLGYNEEINM